MAELAEPGTAAAIARRVGLPRQQVSYHVRELEHAGLVTFVEERRKGNCVERVVQAAARSYVAGQVFVINPGEAHTGDPATPGGYVYRVLYPRLEHFARLAAEIGITRSELFFRDSVLSDGHLAALLHSVHRGVANGASPVRCELLLLKAFKRLITHHSAMGGTTRPTGRERPAVKTACEYIPAHFAEGVSLSGLSALVSLRPYYFARTFEKETGLPPHAY